MQTMSEKDSDRIVTTALPTVEHTTEKMPPATVLQEASAFDRDSKPGFAQKVRDLIATQKNDKYLYITGLRGVLVIESFLWTFFSTFLPTLTSTATPGPWYQTVIRDIFSVPFWNSSFIYNFFILLSMRTICVSFLRNPSGQTYAATMIRRIIRMVVILFMGSGIATLIFSQIGVDFINDFKSKLPNDTIDTPVKTYDAVAALNSLFNLFWLTGDFFTQAANNFWPTHTLWAPSIMYYQSFTVYFLMVILPYTRPKWHLQGLGLFALGSFWYGSWGWYSATGLALADIAINRTLRSELKAGVRVSNDWRLPYWSVAALFSAVGIALKYTFVVLPQFTNSMLVLHPFLDLSQNTTTASYAANGPYPRLDDWFLIVGILLAVELFESLQYAFSSKPLVWLGERSFGIFVAQSIIFWTAGIKLWLVLTEQRGLTTAGANAVVFITCVVAIAVFAELFYFCIDLPSRWLARRTYTWLVN